MLFDTQQRIALNTQQKVWIHNKKLHAVTSGTTKSLAGSHYIDQFTTTREVSLELAYSSACSFIVYLFTLELRKCFAHFVAKQCKHRLRIVHFVGE